MAEIGDVLRNESNQLGGSNYKKVGVLISVIAKDVRFKCMVYWYIIL